MKLKIELKGSRHTVEILQAGQSSQFAIDGVNVDANALEISPGIYSILIGGHSFEARVEPFGGALRITVGKAEFTASVRDPRKWQRNHHAGAISEKRQQVTAPMPGCVVRVLVRSGDQVEAGQGIVVVEAMKMQNEIRSPKTGKVDRVLVVEGQPVSAGDAVAVVA
jgi:biotin carboxyl carrier protein